MFGLSLPLLLCWCASAAPSLHGEASNTSFPTWGGAPKWTCAVNMTAPSDSQSRPRWRFNYFYDSEAQTDRYDHGSGQGDELCSGIADFRHGEPCSVINAADSKTYVTSADARCCIFPTHIGAVRADWLRDGHSIGSQVIAGIDVEVWTVDGQYTNFYASSNDERRRPVRYWEHKVPGPAGLKQWDFDLDTFQLTMPEARLLDPTTLPGNCAAASTCDWHKPSDAAESLVV